MKPGLLQRGIAEFIGTFALTYGRFLIKDTK